MHGKLWNVETMIPIHYWMFLYDGRFWIMLVSGALLTACMFTALAAFYAWWINHRRIVRLGNKIPGPPCNPIVGNVTDAMEVNYDPVKLVQKLVPEFGQEGIMRLWRGFDLFVLISEPAYMQIYYNNTALSKRNEMYDTFDTWLGANNILSAPAEPWKKLRKTMVHTFTAMLPKDMIKVMIEGANKLSDKLNKYSKDEWFEFEPHIALASNELFGRVAMGVDINEYKELTDNLLQSHLLVETIVLRVLSIPHFLNLTFPWTAEGRAFAKISEIIKRELTKIVRQKKMEYDAIISAGMEPPNIYIFNIFDKYKNESIDDVTSQVTTMFGAGVDTTITSIGYAINMLALHQDIQQKVYEEDAEFQARFAGKELDVNDLQEYEYLERVIKETLRIYPVFPQIGRISATDVQFGKYTIPKSTSIILCYQWAHRRADLFPDPKRFDPDRHLPENSKNMHPYALQPFSAGPKNCIGSKFAMLSMKVMLSTLIRNFRFYTQYKSIDEIDANTKATVTMQDLNGVRVRIEKR